MIKYTTLEMICRGNNSKRVKADTKEKCRQIFFVVAGMKMTKVSFLIRLQNISKIFSAVKLKFAVLTETGQSMQEMNIC